MNLEDLTLNLSMEDAKSACFQLFHKIEELSEEEALGMLLYDLLDGMGYPVGRCSFIVITALEWAYGEASKDRRAIIQILDQKYLVYFGQPIGGFHAWDFIGMCEATHPDVPSAPLLSVAISVNKLLSELRCSQLPLQESTEPSKVV